MLRNVILNVILKGIVLCLHNKSNFKKSKFLNSSKKVNKKNFKKFFYPFESFLTQIQKLVLKSNTMRMKSNTVYTLFGHTTK